MAFLRTLLVRWQRSNALARLGPNGARVAFDAVVASVGAAAAWAFCAVFVSGATPVWPVVALPVALLAINAGLGLYTRLRRGSGTTKAALLLAAIVSSAVLVGWPAPVRGLALLWALCVTGPLLVARLVLNLPYSRNSKLARVVVTRKGPILVIGGGGYIGTPTVALLLDRGYSVRVLDRLMYGPAPLADFVGRPGFDLVEGDSTDINKLTLALRNASAVIHLGGLVGDPACAIDAEFTRQANIVATRMASDVAQSLGVHRFIFASSCSVYGESSTQVSETSRPNPVSLYAQTKLDSERELLSPLSDDFFVTVLRFSTVFGHSRRPRFDLVANLFTAQAVMDGVITVFNPDQWRPFIHVQDLARAIVSSLEAAPELVQSEIFNVGDDTLNYTIGQLAEAVRDAVKPWRTAEIVVQPNSADRRTYAVSFAKIRERLGFHSTVSLAAGIAEMAGHAAAGRYQHYSDEIYSNLAMTRKALSQFHDPDELSRLYAPLGAARPPAIRTAS